MAENTADGTPTPGDEWSSPEALSKWLGVPVRTVYAWRHKGTGPKGIRIGKHVRYRKSDVEAWLSECADEGQAA